MIKKLFLVALITTTIGAGALPILAQTKISGQVKTSRNTIDQGYFNVSANQDSVNSLLYHISVEFDRNALKAKPKPAFVNEVDVRLLSAAHVATGNPGELYASATGGVGAFAYTVFPLPGNEAGFFDLSSNPNSFITDGHVFLGDILLKAGSAPIAGAYFNLVGSGSGSGNGIFAASVTPEGASLLLLLPGLIPVAVGLRRRRQSKSAGN